MILICLNNLANRGRNDLRIFVIWKMLSRDNEQVQRKQSQRFKLNTNA
jgi:hypothetical protein